MNNKIAEFLRALEEKLQGMDAEERKNALLYYNEYLSDAEESGKDMYEVFAKLGKPEDLAFIIEAEETLNLAKNKPGVKNFNNAMKKAFIGVSTPFGSFLRGVFLFAVYGVLVLFLGAALLSSIGAIAIFSCFIYEIFKIPSEFFIERLGTLGAGLLSLSLLFMVAFGFFRISQWLMRLATEIIRKMVRGKANKNTYESAGVEKKKNYDKRILIISASVMVLSMILTFASGLPVKMFTIFNSDKPENIKLAINEYNADEVKSIVVNTAHSCISFAKDKSKPDKILITYEQPDWLSYQSGIENGVVNFKEASNGRLPLFDLVSLHESRTRVTIYLPEGYNADEITLESKGGFITITETMQNISAKTYSGQIMLDVSSKNTPFNLKAKTEVGKLDMANIYNVGEERSEISINQQNAAVSFNLESNMGNITVK